MMIPHSRPTCLSSRSTLLSAVAAFALLAGAAQACPLGSHDSPRVRMLHALQQKGHHGHGTTVAQLQSQAGPQTPTKPSRTELGAYGRNLPHGAAAPTSEAKPALQDNLGALSWSIVDTANPEAKAYFDQGYRLGWGFNHAEAARAFRAAQELDPNCTMCLWGEAWVLGPHINYPMEPDANARALAVLERARGVAGAGEMQRALIEALLQRHSPDANADRKALDQAYADAMEAVQARFPQDPDVAVLTADALMNLSPWDYWADGGKTPKGKTDRTVALLEGVLGARQLGPLQAMPDHPGAIHLYIHTVEASDRPERAAPHAARLEALMPGAGHLVHMPSHIWYRLGQWRDSLDANVRAAAADEALMGQGGASLLYAEGYHAHNVHFVMVSALMGGDGRTAVDGAGKLAGIVSDRTKREVPWTQPIAAAPYNAHALVTKPEDVLALDAPDGDFPFVRAAWHYARGVALARLGRTDEARAEMTAIEQLEKTPEIAALTAAGVPGSDVLAISTRVIDARIAQAEGDRDRAATLFREAAEIQDRLPYMEPPFWYYPVHQSLGAALLEQGRTEDAQAAFRAALERSPNNGWAAAGLLRAAEAQGNAQAAEEARMLLQKNWFGAELPSLDRL
ncbi:tetratricopeptide repeat protein [Microvirga sp. GCM10011540]|uniref:tetratricopeptide repeat protein n=1 Tax=Microvirga sp. GCM10011540 TaxID=3317338 RepID=UPI00360E4C36